jgi:hypothetical protein
MNDKPKSKLRWRLLRWGLIALAILVTLAAVLVTEENWRGKRAWQNYQREAEARGERFEWSALMPGNGSSSSAITNAPALTNFVMIEFDERTGEVLKMGGTNLNDFMKKNANLVRKPRETNFLGQRMFHVTRENGSSPKQTGDWIKGELTDLKAWQTYYRTPPTNALDEFPVAPQPQTPARDVLLALSKYDTAIEELRSVTNEMFCFFAGNKLDEHFITASMEYFSMTKGRCQVLQLRSVAELTEAESAALDDIKLLLRLNRELCQMPLLIAHLVGIAETTMTLQPIYEGLVQHRWKEDQLVELEHALAATDILSNYPRAMRGERAFAITSLEDQRITREIKYPDVDPGKTKTISLRWMPAAYFYQNKLAFARMCEQFILPLVDLTNRTVLPTAWNKASADVRAKMKPYSPYQAQAAMLFPGVAASVKKFAAVQSQIDLTRVACALERFHLAHGSYPETLAALAPKFLENIPHDLINGQPLHYRREGEKFILWSVGWDEKDDGGNIVLTKGGGVDRDKGDWVWKN